MGELVWLGTPASGEPAIVGGKAAPLGRLAAQEPPPAHVPPGFVIPPGAVDGDAVTAAYARLGERCGRSDPPVAVRSSALGEDSPRASFAGQHLTLLPVTGATAVLDAARRCRASAASPRASAYRDAHGLPGVPMAVLVQRFVEADASAVAFTANPITGDRDEVVIEAVLGAGQALVDGTVTPERTIVRRDEQPAAIIALSVAQAREVAALAVALETLEGHPVDIECAYERGTLQLLQCQPLTTLARA